MNLAKILGIVSGAIQGALNGQINQPTQPTQVKDLEIKDENGTIIDLNNLKLDSNERIDVVDAIGKMQIDSFSKDNFEIEFLTRVNQAQQEIDRKSQAVTIHTTNNQEAGQQQSNPEALDIVKKYLSSKTQEESKTAGRSLLYDHPSNIRFAKIINNPRGGVDKILFNDFDGKLFSLDVTNNGVIIDSSLNEISNDCFMFDGVIDNQGRLACSSINSLRDTAKFVVFGQDGQELINTNSTNLTSLTAVGLDKNGNIVKLASDGSAIEAQSYGQDLQNPTNVTLPTDFNNGITNTNFLSVANGVLGASQPGSFFRTAIIDGNAVSNVATIAGSPSPLPKIVKFGDEIYTIATLDGNSYIIDENGNDVVNQEGIIDSISHRNDKYLVSYRKRDGANDYKMYVKEASNLADLQSAQENELSDLNNVVSLATFSTARVHLNENATQFSVVGLQTDGAPDNTVVATYDITGANPSLVGVVQVSGELSNEFFQDQLNFMGLVEKSSPTKLEVLRIGLSYCEEIINSIDNSVLSLANKTTLIEAFKSQDVAIESLSTNITQIVDAFNQNGQITADNLNLTNATVARNVAEAFDEFAKNGKLESFNNFAKECNSVFSNITLADLKSGTDSPSQAPIAQSSAPTRSPIAQSSSPTRAPIAQSSSPSKAPTGQVDESKTPTVAAANIDETKSPTPETKYDDPTLSPEIIGAIAGGAGALLLIGVVMVKRRAAQKAAEVAVDAIAGEVVEMIDVEQPGGEINAQEVSNVAGGPNKDGNRR